MALLEFVKMSFYALATQAAWQQQQQTIHSNSGQGRAWQAWPNPARPGPAHKNLSHTQRVKLWLMPMWHAGAHVANGRRFRYHSRYTRYRGYIQPIGSSSPQCGPRNRALSHRSATSFSAFDKRLTNVSDFVFVSLHFMLPTQTYITHTVCEYVCACLGPRDGYRYWDI